tara:strand:+ start:826 stop:1521 length:696 start_codon:yes stop_codon:yes gene_type:complete
MTNLLFILLLLFGCEESKVRSSSTSELYNNNIAIFKGTYISHNIDKLIIELSDSLVVNGKKSNIINVPPYSSGVEAKKTEVICTPNVSNVTYETPINYIAYTDYSYSSGDGVKHIFPDTLTLVLGAEIPSTFMKKVGDIEVAEHKWSLIGSSSSSAKHDIWISNNSDSNVKIKVKIQYFSKRNVKVFENYVTIEQLFNSKDTKKVSVNSKLENSDIIDSARITIDSIYYIN